MIWHSTAGENDDDDDGNDDDDENWLGRPQEAVPIGAAAPGIVGLWPKYWQFVGSYLVSRPVQV